MRCPNCSHEWIPSSGELAAEMGRKGGSATSRKKSRAAKRNARLGGWPKGKKRGKRKPKDDQHKHRPNDKKRPVALNRENEDANRIAHRVVGLAEKLTQQGRPPQRLKVLPNPKSPKRGG